MIEDGYVDKDYLDEFSAFYSRSFKAYHQRCTRLHFFSADIPESTPPLGLGKFRDSYLGFVVVRPTDLQRIGRTLLAPFLREPQTEFVCCQAKFYAHILGEKFTVSAMPFIQQDTQVGACAQASLWMLARYMSQRFHYREYLPAEINILAKSVRAFGRTFPAEWGLDLDQILQALNAMGYSAVVYGRQNIDQCSKHIDSVFPIDRSAASDIQSQQTILQQTAKLADITYRYIESRLPVILCTTNHALVAIGHTYDHTVTAALAIQRIPEFIVNNDAEGPYGKIPIFSSESTGLSFQLINDIVVVVPPEVTLRGEEAESMASQYISEFLGATFEGNRTWRQALQLIRPQFQNWFDHLEFRTYLRPSVEWQADLIQCMTADPKRTQVASKLLALDYPKYVWITEVSSSSLLNQVERDKRQCLGCIVVDSTAPLRTDGTIAMHFADVLVIRDRQGNLAPELRYIKDTTPFLHKIW